MPTSNTISTPLEQPETPIDLLNSLLIMIGRAIIVALDCGLYQSTNSNIGSLTCTHFQYVLFVCWFFKKWNEDFSQDAEPLAETTTLRVFVPEQQQITNNFTQCDDVATK
mmetsp:Transcript_2418/g.3599  ORF Transcript_2418/g.3599 Transcript_2418/m.3599 type:complete len:110 (+) Transcript_2418:850-1179(+)|eukprot:scaffold9522_cov195-Skeletonema_dohrnii-CCMP3373.AAC.2